MNVRVKLAACLLFAVSFAEAQLASRFEHAGLEHVAAEALPLPFAAGAFQWTRAGGGWIALPGGSVSRGFATLGVHDGHVSAHAFDAQGRVWELNAGRWREITGTALLKDPSFSGDALEPRQLQPAASSGTQRGNADGAVIDLFIVYTRQAREARGSTSAIEALIREAVAQANLVLSNSAVATRVRLVGTAERDYPEAANLVTDLTRLTDPDDEFLDDVHALRDEHGADLVSLFVSSGGAPVCGLAWINRVQGPGFAPFGFSVVVHNCAVAAFGLAHEIGHNLGAAHDPANSNGPGMFPYSYGFRRTDFPAFRDIMSSPCATGCPPVPYFSNPAVRVDGRTAVGSPIADAAPADNARTIDTARVWVANFRDGVVEPAVAPDQVELPAENSSGTIRVNLSAPWKAVASDAWIRVTPSEGAAPATVRFTANANPSQAERVALININNDTVLVRQAGAGNCDVFTSTAEVFLPGIRSRDSIEISALPACSWIASTTADWLSIRTARQASGSRTLVIEAAENPSSNSSRTAVLNTGGARVNVTQLPASRSCAASSIAFDAIVTEQLDFDSCQSAYGPLNAFAAKYKFTAVAGERLRITASSPSLVPALALLAPSGATVAFEAGNGPGHRAALTRLGAVTLPESGEYVLEVAEAGATRSFGIVHLAVGRSGFSPATPGVFRAGQWLADLNRDRTWREREDLSFAFGESGDTPVIGDWDATGHHRVGVFRDGEWFLDISGNLEFATRDDESYKFGQAGDKPIAGDWDATGRHRFGVFRNGVWTLDLDGDHKQGAGDVTFRFGQAGDSPLFADWDNSGKQRVGVFRDGVWLLDIDGNREWNETLDRAASFGQAGDIPVTGDWDGTGKVRIGVFRDGVWMLDRDGDMRWDESVDLKLDFGQKGDKPVPAAW